MVHPAAKPNAAHKALAALEREGRLQSVITQNIDGLHQKAGSVNVCELHGSVNRNACMECKRAYALSEMIELSKNGIPLCGCGAVIKPNVVLYGEQLDEGLIHNAIRHITAADTLIIGGTSLSVNPAASLVQYFDGENLILINRDETPYDYKAGLIIRDSIGMVFENSVKL
jgi:NAD-dependent deacetylase